jgi:hypothetical protein
MSYNIIIGYGYDIYDCFTMEHFRLHQRMNLTTKIYCSRLYLALSLPFERHDSVSHCYAKVSVEESIVNALYG